MSLLFFGDKTLDPSSQAMTLTDYRSPDNPIVYVNKGFERLSGHSREEAVGKSCRFLQGPRTDPKAVAELSAAIKEARPVIVDLLNYRKDGSTFWNRVSVKPVKNEAGRATHFIGIQSDITHLIELEERLHDLAQALAREADGRAVSSKVEARIVG